MNTPDLQMKPTPVGRDHKNYSFLKRMSIGAKLYSGFGIIVLLSVVLGTMTDFSINKFEHSLVQYEEMVKDVQLIEDLSKEIAKMRIAVIKYMATGSEEARSTADHAWEEVEQLVALSQKEIQNPDRAALVDQIDKKIHQYREGLVEIKRLIDHRNQIVRNQLNKIGPELRKKLTAINQGAFKAGDHESASFAGIAQEDLLLARLYVLKYLDTNTEEDADRFQEEFGKLKYALIKLGASLENPERRQLLSQVNEQAPQYKEAFEKLVETIQERNRIRSEVLDKNGALVSQKILQVLESAEHDEELVQEEVNTEISDSETSNFVGTLIVLVLGLGIAFFITRQIAGPLTQVTVRLNGISNGDLNQEAIAVDSGDEVGVLGKTFNHLSEGLKS